MNIITNIIKTIAILLIFSSSFADDDVNVELYYDDASHESIAGITNPYLNWKRYLKDKGMEEGTNTKPDGSTYMIAYGETLVGKPINDPGFMRSRNRAYTGALLDAKAAMAKFLKVELKSNRTFILEGFGNDKAPDIVKNLEKPLSIIDKVNKLSGLALDNEIKKFDSDWDGTNKTDQDRNIKVAYQRELIIENYSNSARAFLQGTTPIFNAEGPDDEGRHTVVVGIVWTPRSMLVAESIYNPTVPSPQGPKKASTIRERLNKLTDEELAASLGLRVWWDEEGLPVIISFGQATAKGSPTIARNESALIARTQISQFVSEQIVAKDTLQARQDTRYYEDEDESYEAFDEGKFETSIVAMSKTLPISGVETVLYKKIYHPVTDKKIVVNVMSWNPESNKVARNLSKLSKEQETKIDATDGGTVFENYEVATDDNEVAIDNNSVGTSTIGLEGVSSDPDDF